VSGPLTLCERAAKDAMPDNENMVGVYVPQCDEEGNYRPLQRWPSTGYRWCVNKYGQMIDGTDTPPTEPDPVCSNITGYYVTSTSSSIKCNIQKFLTLHNWVI